MLYFTSMLERKNRLRSTVSDTHHFFFQNAKNHKNILGHFHYCPIHSSSFPCLPLTTWRTSYRCGSCVPCLWSFHWTCIRHTPCSNVPDVSSLPYGFIWICGCKGTKSLAHKRISHWLYRERINFAVRDNLWDGRGVGYAKDSHSRLSVCKETRHTYSWNHCGSIWDWYDVFRNMCTTFLFLQPQKVAFPNHTFVGLAKIWLWKRLLPPEAVTRRAGHIFGLSGE